MSRRLLIVVLSGLTLFGLLAVPALAQSQSRAEVFGGYQYSRIGGSNGFNANGWNTAVTGNIDRNLGITADFSGSYKTVSGIRTAAYTYTFGPVVSLSKNRNVVPFVHALFGGLHLSASLGGVTASTNGTAGQLGGGVDAKATHRIAVRIIQADWMIWRAERSTSNKNFRISSGLVLRF